MTGSENMGYKVGDKWFSSKKAIANHCRKIIKEAPQVPQLSAVHRRHEPFLKGLIARHPNKVDGWGDNISRFVVDSKRGGLAFQNTAGGTRIFSFLKCADGREVSLHAQFVQACRWAIRPTIIEFRDYKYRGSNVVECALSGELVLKSQCHVDHVRPSFRSIVETYQIAVDDWMSIELANNIGWKFRWPEDAEDFRSFHDEVAVLQITTAKANIRKS